jgi:hypothetical protein
LTAEIAQQLKQMNGFSLEAMGLKWLFLGNFEGLLGDQFKVWL